MQKQKTGITWFYWIIIGVFLGYLAFSQNDFNGNSLLIGIAGIICIVLGLLQTKRVHRKVIKQLGIVEVDLDEAKQNDEQVKE